MSNPAPKRDSGPVAAFEEQERQFAGAFALIEQAIRERVFPGAALAVTLRGRMIAHRGFGHFTYESASPAVAAETIFDLASVTKVVAATAMAMVLYERGELDLDIPLVSITPEFAGDDARRREITVRQLLAHSSGIPAYARLFETAKDRDALLHAALTMPLDADPGTRTKYSDIGFIVLGEVLSRIAGDPLDRFCQRSIFGPLGMAHTLFKPAVPLRLQMPPTMDDKTFRRRVIQGEVQDENAFVLGGISAHAGLFSNAADVVRFAHCVLQGGAPILRQTTVDLFTRRGTSPPGTSRALGWDTPSQPSQSGKHLSPRSFGHLGYTGTSLWIDPERELSVTLLTNRTWPEANDQSIKRVRPLIHDAVVEALE